MRLLAYTAVALIVLAGCASQRAQPVKAIERVPDACREAFQHVEAAVDEYGKQAVLTAQEFTASNERARLSLNRYTAAKKTCLR